MRTENRRLVLVILGGACAAFAMIFTVFPDFLDLRNDEASGELARMVARPVTNRERIGKPAESKQAREHGLTIDDTKNGIRARTSEKDRERRSRVLYEETIGSKVSMSEALTKVRGIEAEIGGDLPPIWIMAVSRQNVPEFVAYVNQKGTLRDDEIISGFQAIAKVDGGTALEKIRISSLSGEVRKQSLCRVVEAYLNQDAMAASEFVSKLKIHSLDDFDACKVIVADWLHMKRDFEAERKWRE